MTVSFIRLRVAAYSAGLFFREVRRVVQNSLSLDAVD
jgi:hypothetical protein